MATWGRRLAMFRMRAGGSRRGCGRWGRQLGGRGPIGIEGVCEGAVDRAILQQQAQLAVLQQRVVAQGSAADQYTVLVDIDDRPGQTTPKPSTLPLSRQHRHPATPRR